MAIHSHYLHNGEVKKSTEPGLYPGQLGLLSGWGIFSTLRVADGALFAWERHWARMSRDAVLLNVPMPFDAAAVEDGILRLIEANAAYNSTLRISVVRNGGGLFEGPCSGLPSDVIAFTANSKSWGESVRLGVQANGRFAASDFTSAKILSWAHNLRWLERAQQQGFDEVLLLNEHGRIAECTSANIFAVSGDEIATPPVHEGCLPGITREILVEAIAVPGIRCVERSLTLDDLWQADEVLITSTTRGLLPVREIAGRELNRRHRVSELLSRAFRNFLTEDIARRRRAVAPV
jgi:branched-chain amino acid aminotransferase